MFSIALLGAVLGMFFALAVVIRDRTRSPGTLYLAGALIILFATFVDEMLTDQLAYAAFPALFGWVYFVILGLGPLIWLHIAAIADPEDAGWRRARPHVWACVATSLLLVPYMLLPGDARWHAELGRDEIGEENYGAMNLAVLLVILVTYLQPAIYLVWSVRRAGGIVGAVKRRWATGLLIVAAVSWITFIAYIPLSFMGVDDQISDGINSLWIEAGILGLGLLAIANPPDPLSVPNPFPQEKYARTGVSDDDVDRIFLKLGRTNMSLKLHRDPDVTLQKLAAALLVKPNKLSQVLNLEAGGYHKWLSGVRVEDAKQMMIENPDCSILEAAFTAGFNSKSTFYDAFKRLEGKSPRQWREGAAPTSPDAERLT